jgi:hypothetical protein
MHITCGGIVHTGAAHEDVGNAFEGLLLARNKSKRCFNHPLTLHSITLNLGQKRCICGIRVASRDAIMRYASSYRSLTIPGIFTIFSLVVCMLASFVQSSFVINLYQSIFCNNTSVQEAECAIFEKASGP